PVRRRRLRRHARLRGRSRDRRSAPQRTARQRDADRAPRRAGAARGAGWPSDDLDFDSGPVRGARRNRLGPRARRGAGACDRARRRGRFRRQGSRLSRGRPAGRRGAPAAAAREVDRDPSRALPGDGARRPEVADVLDRLLERAARRSGIDPAALRRRNLIRADEMPYTTGLRYRDGAPIVYDPADYPAAFDRLLARFGYDEWRTTQKS